MLKDSRDGYRYNNVIALKTRETEPRTGGRTISKGKHPFTSSKSGGFRRWPTMDKEVAGGKAKPEGTLKLRLKLRQGLDPIDSTKQFPSFLV